MSMEEKLSFPVSQDSDLETPETEEKVSNIIKKFYKSNITIEIIGSGSKRKIGKPLQCGKTLSLSKLTGIIEYLPEELYIKVKAGTRIDKIENEIRGIHAVLFTSSNQMKYFKLPTIETVLHKLIETR